MSVGKLSVAEMARPQAANAFLWARISAAIREMGSGLLMTSKR
jgi:hypothetical protein